MKTLGLAVLVAFGLGAIPADAQLQSHLDPGLVEGGCGACHAGHGVSRSPMLPAPQSDVCLSCHGSQAEADQLVSRRKLSPVARPQFLDSVLSQPFQHPLSRTAYSRTEPGVVTCTSCHSPHRSVLRTNETLESAPLRKRSSPKDPRQFEYELCQECHGRAGASTQSLLDLSRLTSPNNTSFHPIEGPAVGNAPSTLPDLQGSEISCSDCHGNSDRDGPAGPHGSSVRFILAEDYVTVDGAEEAGQTYALCYGCHDRQRVLDSPVFPLHELHVVEERAACATCHNAHGSVDNRALVRFGEDVHLSGVSASIGAGRLAFESSGPGSGSCYLLCHGVDHAPRRYGMAAMAVVEEEGGLETPNVPDFALGLERAPTTTPTRPKETPELPDG